MVLQSQQTKKRDLVTGFQDQLQILPVPDFPLWTRTAGSTITGIDTRIHQPYDMTSDYCRGHAHFNFQSRALACDSMVVGCLAEASAYVVTAASKGRLAPWTCKHMQAAPSATGGVLCGRPRGLGSNSCGG
jgi:hypothetical protein